ncbi:MAG: septum formation initiator family protein [Parvularculaceae bacterium]
MRRIGAFARDVALPALFACWIVYLAYGAVAGAASYRTLRDLHEEVALRKAELAGIVARHEALQKRAELLNPKSLDPDMIDERVRAVLGYARAGDIVLPRSEIDRLLARKPER